MNFEKYIARTMLQQLNKKAFEDITVQSILDECEVARSTFYRYFKDKYDLMNRCYLIHIDEIIANYKGDNWPELLGLIYQFNEDNSQYLKNAYSVTGANTFSECIYDHIFNMYHLEYLERTNADRLSTMESKILSFFSGGICFAINQWVNSPRKESARDMANWAYTFIPDPFRKYF